MDYRRKVNIKLQSFYPIAIEDYLYQICHFQTKEAPDVLK